MPPPTDLLPGTLDALILKAVSLSRQHGYGVMMRIQQITGGAFRIEEGRFIRRCIASNIRVISPVSGASPITTAGPSTTS